VTFEVFTAVEIQESVFWIVTLCSDVGYASFQRVMLPSLHFTRKKDPYTASQPRRL